ncbi:DUF4376 domain-containing protein [Rhizobium sp. RU36D]|uniref:DUF4376 domain-containing protein n=1 Tax=Rhizobium sp. RU36D TaxID=1907415 RepID=UPI0009D8CB10|nr:DUF4376 domain-containing protein [Rhizobium sp. RU36D]SMD18412.1 protein of unknown function [Rhizobium sp. RU36D]
MTFARINNGIVVEIISVPDGFALSDCFTADIVDQCHPSPQDVGAGWTFANGVFAEPVAPEIAALDPAALVAYAASKRWQVEVGGTVVAGIPVATDDRSKIMIAGARIAAADDPDWTTVWHGADGHTYPINAAQMIAISNAVQAHVNATFVILAGVKGLIESGDISTTAAIDAAFSA